MKTRKRTISDQQMARETQRFFVMVCAWMSFALIVTGLTAYVIASSPGMIVNFSENRILMAGLLIFEVAIVMILVGGIKKMSEEMASLLFIAYSILNGFTLSVIFLVFTEESLATAFFVTAGTFAIMSSFGYLTKFDLTAFGNLLFMGLLGLVLATLINLHYQNNEVTWITTYFGVVLFIGLIAYDTQEIKKLVVFGNEESEEKKKSAIIGALTLYLDFINLFLKFLNIFGKRK
ncbi:MAG: Bax inhibitor-1/YccA family protein [Mariniphaga sp.]